MFELVSPSDYLDNSYGTDLPQRKSVGHLIWKTDHRSVFTPAVRVLIISTLTFVIRSQHAGRADGLVPGEVMRQTELLMTSDLFTEIM